MKIHTPEGQYGQVVIFLHRAATHLPQFASSRRKPCDPAACPRASKLLGTAVTTNQQVGSNLLAETHPPTPRDPIEGLESVEGMLSDTIKVYEHAKHPRRTTPPSPCIPLGLQNAAHAAFRHIKRKIEIESGHNTSHR
jgi:hypothetical protein